MKVNKFFKSIALLVLIGQIHSQLVSGESKPKKNVLLARMFKHDKGESFKQHLKKTVVNNVFWARSYIISEYSDLSDKEQIKERLLKNQQNFFKILAPIYGKGDSTKVTDLLREHKNITLELIKAVKNNNKNEIKNLETKWYKNIKDLSVFVNKLIPSLSVNYLTNLFSGLLKLTKQEMVLRSTKQWQADIQNFDKIVDYATNMADALATAIIKRFAE